jgi:hypothetical protein
VLASTIEVATPIPGHQHHVLDPTATEAGVVQPRFDGDDDALLQYRSVSSDSGRLVNVESDPMTCAVEKSDPGTIAFLGRETGIDEDLLDALMDRISTAPGRIKSMARC